MPFNPVNLLARQRQRLYAAYRAASNSELIQARRLHALVLVLWALFSLGAGPPTLKSLHDFPLRLSPGQMNELQLVSKGPEIAASAAIVVDRGTGSVIWGDNAGSSLPMASTTKLMTAILAKEYLDLDQILVVPTEAIIGDSSMGLAAGDQVSVLALLYGALLPSGNDAAMTLAIRSAGSEAAFVQLMNQRAQQWGLAQTTFRNPHGLDAPGHVSSARDQVTLAMKALADPVIADIVATPSIWIEGYQLTNTNDLLTTYAGSYGVKTGTTVAAGQVLIAAARRSDDDGIAVVMNSPDRFREVPRLLDYYFDLWTVVDTQLQRNALNKATASDGTTYLLRTVSGSLLLLNWQARQVRPQRLISFDAEDQPSGLWQLWVGEEKVYETPITFIPIGGSDQEYPEHASQ